MDELTRTTAEIKSMLAALDQKMDSRFDALEARFETRFASLEARFETRFTGLQTRFDARFGGVDARFTALEARSNQWFLSIVGLQAMTLLAIAAGLFGIVTKLL